MGKFKLLEGVVIKPYGENSLLTQDNLTDEIASLLIKKNKAKREDFKITKAKNNGNSK